MKVFLLSCNPVDTPYPVYPLGMSVVAAALIKAGHEVYQFDMLKQGFNENALRDAVTSYAPGLIGISFRNLDNANSCHALSYVHQVARLVAVLREVSSAPITIGGSGFSVLPERVLEISGADFGTVGEGERLVVELANTLARGEKPGQRVSYADSSLGPTEMVSPAYDDAILDFYLRGGGVTPLQTKRGCTYHCAYCTYPVLEGHRLRPRDCEAVVDDIQRLQEKGAKQIFFTDSIFNDAQGHYRQLVAAMCRRKVNIPWTGFFRPEVIPPDVIQQMKATGLNAVELGSDASSDTTLRAMGKSFRFEEIQATHASFVNSGLTVSHYFMMGGPDESPETVQEGIANILTLNGAASFVFLGIRILPGTTLAARALSEGVISETTDLLQPVYYFSPRLERDWLHATLLEGFKHHRQVVYPPDAYDSGLAFLHRLGYSGMSIDLLLKKGGRGAEAPAK